MSLVLLQVLLSSSFLLLLSYVRIYSLLVGRGKKLSAWLAIEKLERTLRKKVFWG